MQSIDVEITDVRRSIEVSAFARQAEDWGSIPHGGNLFFQRLVPGREFSLYLTHYSPVAGLPASFEL